MNNQLEFHHNFNFDEELSLAYHYVAVGNIESLWDQYFSLVLLHAESAADEGKLYGLLVDIIALIIEVNIPYNIYEDQNGNHVISYLHDASHLKIFLNSNKFPWVEAVGLKAIIENILDFNEKRPKLNPKSFVKAYDHDSIVKFGVQKGCRIADLLERSPELILSYVEELYHFYLSHALLIDPILIKYFVERGELMRYWAMVCRCIIKGLLKEDLEYIRSVTDNYFEGIFREDRLAQDGLWSAYEGDSSNQYNTD